MEGEEGGYVCDSGMDEPCRLRANGEHGVLFTIEVRKEYGCELGWAQITATGTPHYYPPLPKHYAEAFQSSLSADILLLLAQSHVSMKYCCYPSVMHSPNCMVHLGGKSTARIVSLCEDYPNKPNIKTNTGHRLILRKI